MGIGLELLSLWEVPKPHHGSEDAVSAGAGLLLWDVTEALYKQDPSLQQSSEGNKVVIPNFTA